MALVAVGVKGDVSADDAVREPLFDHAHRPRHDAAGVVALVRVVRLQLVGYLDERGGGGEGEGAGKGGEGRGGEGKGGEGGGLG